MKVNKKSYYYPEGIVDLILRTCLLLRKHKDLDGLNSYCEDIKLQKKECNKCKETYVIEQERHYICINCESEIPKT